MSDTAPAGAPPAAEVRAPADLLARGLLTDPEVWADPYPVYHRLRALAPVHVSASGRVFLSRYDDCLAAVRHPALGAQTPQWMDKVAPGWRERPAAVQNIESMLFRDPPDHTRLRRIVNGIFVPRRVARMREQVGELVERTLDAFADAGAGGAVVQAYQLLASALPVSVLGTVLGIPAADWPMLHHHLSAVMQVVETGAGEQQLAEADAGALLLRDYFADLVAQRRKAPGDDIITVIVAARDSGPGPDGAAAGEVSEVELLQTLILLFGAGIDTTLGMLSNGLLALLRHPDQAALLRADPGLAAGAVDEMLRYDSPTQVVVRIAGPGAAAGGVPIPPDSSVFVLTGAAHRDPARFADPDRFDITRTGTSVLSFSGGIHYCVGAPLARLEAEMFFPALLRRFPGLALAGQPVRSGFVVRGFASLPVTIGSMR